MKKTRLVRVFFVSCLNRDYTDFGMCRMKSNNNSIYQKNPKICVIPVQTICALTILSLPFISFLNSIFLKPLSLNS